MKFLFAMLLCVLSFGQANALVFVNKDTMNGYKIVDGQLKPLVGQVDTFGTVFWVDSFFHQYRENPKVIQVARNVYEAKLQTGWILDHIDDSGTMYFYHARIVINRKQAEMRVKRVHFFDPPQITFEAWLEQDFETVQTYQIID